jgi:hypothetical protein
VLERDDEMEEREMNKKYKDVRLCQIKHKHTGGRGRKGEKWGERVKREKDRGTLNTETDERKEEIDDERERER